MDSATGTMAAMPTSTSMGMTMSTSSASMAANMMMVFNTANQATMIFSSSFMPTTEGQYVGAWFFCFFLAVIWRALVFLQLKLDRHWTNKFATHPRLVNEGKEQERLIRVSQPWRLSVNLPRAALAYATQSVAYLLMIIVMTMNVGLFFAVTVGYFIGELFFGRVSVHNSYTQSC